MSVLSDYQANAFATSIRAAGLYIALYNGDPGGDGLGGTEKTTSINGVAVRPTVTWAAVSDMGNGKGISNDGEFVWKDTAANVSPETVTHLAIFDNATVGAGNLLWKKPLENTKTIENSDPVKFADGAISWSTE